MTNDSTRLACGHRSCRICRGTGLAPEQLETACRSCHGSAHERLWKVRQVSLLDDTGVETRWAIISPLGKTLATVPLEQHARAVELAHMAARLVAQVVHR